MMMMTTMTMISFLACFKIMERRILSRFLLAFIVALSISFNSSFVHAQSPDSSFNFFLGEENMESWKDELVSSIGGAPGPTYDTGTLVLAANRTKRPDILSGFRKYRGGWDISNKHYWASVCFTGAATFVLAVVWFISFGSALLLYYFCGWKINISGEKNPSCTLRICLALLTIFATATLTGCVLLSFGQVKFHRETFATLNYLVNQSEYTVQTLRNVTEYLSLAKNTSVSQTFLPSDVMKDIDRLNLNLYNAADTLEVKTNDNSIEIRKVFNTVRWTLIAVAAVMLFVSILGLVLSIFRYQHMIQVFIVSGWLLVAITFFLCSISVILDNTISDTCMAMGEWEENPHAETALSNILPCVDETTTNQTLFKSKQVINDIVVIINEFVGSVANSNPPSRLIPTYYNQSGPTIPPLCYPYDSQLQDRNCSTQEISVENASQVWQGYRCSVSKSGICSSRGRLTPDMYTELVDAVKVSYALEHYTPLLLNLRNCNFVRDTFRNITSNYCPVLERDLGIVNAGLALISVGVMLSLALWIVYANRPHKGGSVC